jgi:hypothetical protein
MDFIVGTLTQRYSQGTPTKRFKYVSKRQVYKNV